MHIKGAFEMALLIHCSDKITGSAISRAPTLCARIYATYVDSENLKVGGWRSLSLTSTRLFVYAAYSTCPSCHYGADVVLMFIFAIRFLQG